MSVGSCAPYRGDDAVRWTRGGEGSERRTSGKVPLEKTLRCSQYHGGGHVCMFGGHGDSHEETGLSTSTVTNNDQLATDFRHLRDGLTRCGGPGRVR